MASNQPNPKRDEGGQAPNKDKGGDGANKGTSSGGTPGGKLPNDKSSQRGPKSTGGQK